MTNDPKQLTAEELETILRHQENRYASALYKTYPEMVDEIDSLLAHIHALDDEIRRLREDGAQLSTALESIPMCAAHLAERISRLPLTGCFACTVDSIVTQRDAIADQRDEANRALTASRDENAALVEACVTADKEGIAICRVCSNAWNTKAEGPVHKSYCPVDQSSPRAQEWRAEVEEPWKAKLTEFASAGKQLNDAYRMNAVGMASASQMAHEAIERAQRRPERMIKDVELELLIYCWQLAQADRDVERVTDNYVNGKATIREKESVMRERKLARLQVTAFARRLTEHAGAVVDHDGLRCTKSDICPYCRRLGTADPARETKGGE